MTKILVTGGAGFIGHEVINQLQNLGHSATAADIITAYNEITPEQMHWLFNWRTKRFHNSVRKVDITDSIEIPQIFLEEKPEVVIHLAAFPRAKIVNAHPTYGSAVMIQGLINVLEQSKNVKRFVYISSSMVYGDFAKGVIEDAPLNPQGYYAILKRCGEDLVRDYCKAHNIEYVIVRPSAVYGPGDLIDRVIPTFFQNALTGKPLKVNGEGQRLDFTYVTDIAQGIVLAATHVDAANETFNITAGNGQRIYDAAKMVTEIVGKGEIEIHPSSDIHPSRDGLSIANAKRLLDYSPQVPLNIGLNKYYEYLQSSVFWPKASV